MKKIICIGLIFALFTAALFASESDGIFTWMVGHIEVSMLVERENPGNPAIVASADPAILSRYLPAAGFTHATNAFLVKAYGKNYIIDTGFGAALFDKIRLLGVSPEQVDGVLLTHLHGDHIGGLQRDGRPLFPRAKIYLSERELNHFTRVAVNQGAVAAMAAYGNNVETFNPPEAGPVRREVVPGITAVAAYGHTPGHTVFVIEGGRSKMLIIGDLLHVALVQFPHPEISASFDMDAKAAADMRKSILGFAAEFGIPVGGMHMVYPAVGIVEYSGNGFSFLPFR